eukprot:CAMPEP_0194439630 /NCGR_PEP_ID=MMETSP0176-20130528/111564_1 /TAXON_ID=216777 /ORGANISM="Proboscia alata, Strain PI-D3" /LENGTH=166 /DNA_ID=CAMNT_0039263029 /DNA_START=207 /DNA_END=705 /DNA_ORIENTATION=+
MWFISTPPVNSFAAPIPPPAPSDLHPQPLQTFNDYFCSIGVQRLTVYLDDLMSRIRELDEQSARSEQSVSQITSIPCSQTITQTGPRIRHKSSVVAKSRYGVSDLFDYREPARDPSAGQECKRERNRSDGNPGGENQVHHHGEYLCRHVQTFAQGRKLLVRRMLSQ